jgi:hypothetical protein
MGRACFQAVVRVFLGRWARLLFLLVELMASIWSARSFMLGEGDDTQSCSIPIVARQAGADRRPVVRKSTFSLS